MSFFILLPSHHLCELLLGKEERQDETLHLWMHSRSGWLGSSAPRDAPTQLSPLFYGPNEAQMGKTSSYALAALPSKTLTWCFSLAGSR